MFQINLKNEARLYVFGMFVKSMDNPSLKEMEN